MLSVSNVLLSVQIALLLAAGNNTSMCHTELKTFFFNPCSKNYNWSWDKTDFFFGCHNLLL